MTKLWAKKRKTDRKDDADEAKKKPNSKYGRN